MKTCISVIIPVYNKAPYLKKCLQSIQKQSLRDIEIICVNDGSTDDSLEILKEIQGQDNRIKVFSQKNHGVSSARNFGIENASGEFIVFMDADDWLPDDRTYEDLFNAAVNNHSLICGGSVARYNNDGEFIPYPRNEKSIFLKDRILSFREYQYDFGFTRFIFNRGFIKEEKLYFRKLVAYEDPVFLAEALHKAKCFYALKRVVYCTRRGHKSYELNFKQVEDLLTAIALNIKLAQDNDYEKLLDLQKERLIKNYIRRGLGKVLVKDESGGLRAKLNDINLLLNDKSGIEYEAFQYYIDLQAQKIENLEKRVKKLEGLLTQRKEGINVRLLSSWKRFVWKRFFP